MDPFYLFWMVCVAAIGLALGSYIAALCYRLPRGIRSARSACPACGHTLAARDLVPVFSWLWLRGRCRYCAAPISPRYMMIEAGVMALALALFIALF